ncbi:hypothetical protein [Pedobacter faecalis]|uniref:hypothetical protein n=1 Tax=Pedobacter faecalis TaxID=3041495 RepID=UPI002551BAF7|nr:hypothetical protein [Pedobacter sp. ELA7]
MMDSNLFLNKSCINNFDEIIHIIDSCGITPGTIAVEHVGDVLSFLNDRDKKRDINDPELKKAAFTVIKTILDTGIAELMWAYTWVEWARENPPKDQDELFRFLDDYWYKTDFSGLDRTYLVFFRRKGQTWP